MYMYKCSKAFEACEGFFTLAMRGTMKGKPSDSDFSSTSLVRLTKKEQED